MADNGYSRLVQDLSGEENRLRAFIARGVKDPHAAADIYQEIWVRLLGRAHEDKVETPVAYAYRVAKNLMNDFYRMAKAAHGEVTEAIPAEAPLQDRVFLSKQRLQQLHDTLESMPPLRREVFVRRRLMGHSHQTIASDLGLTITATEKHVGRALSTLYQALEDGE